MWQQWSNSELLAHSLGTSLCDRHFQLKSVTESEVADKWLQKSNISSSFWPSSSKIIKEMPVTQICYSDKYSDDHYEYR